LFQYRTTRTALGGDPSSPNNNNLSTISNTGNNTSSSGHALLNQSVVVESDSEGDFPESVKSSDDDDGRCAFFVLNAVYFGLPVT